MSFIRIQIMGSNLANIFLLVGDICLNLWIYWDKKKKRKKVIKVGNFIVTLPKGATNCWRAAILSPNFSFLTCEEKENPSTEYTFNEVNKAKFRVETKP